MNESKFAHRDRQSGLFFKLDRADNEISQEPSLRGDSVSDPSSF